MKFIIAVDDFRSYELIESFQPYHKVFEQNMVFEIHLKLFKKGETTFLTFSPNDCVGTKEIATYCTTKSYEDDTNVSGLGSESLKHICLKAKSLPKYFSYITMVKNSCFKLMKVIDGFKECTDKVYEQVIDQ